MKLLRNILFLFILAFPIIWINAKDNIQRGTADYYEQSPDRYMGKSVSVYILMAAKTTYPAPDNYTAFIAQTASAKGEDCGKLIIYVRTMRADKFEKKYATGYIVNGVPQVTQISGKYMKAIGLKTYAIMMN